MPILKRIKISLLLIFINAIVAIGQESTYILTISSPDKVEDTYLSWGEEELQGIIQQETNFGQDAAIHSNAWTVNGIKATKRGLIKFDLDQLPSNAEIVNAKLSLYHLPYTDQYWPMSNLSGSNEVYLKRVTTDWSENVVTWNTQPETTDENQVILPESSSRTQDYLDVDVTELTKKMFVSGLNYGFMIQLVTEEYYRSMIFCSSEHSNSNYHPKLVIDYKISDSKQAPISNVRKISATQGGFIGKLEAGDAFCNVSATGDINGDGYEDMIVGTPMDDDGGVDKGAVWVLFLDGNKTVISQQKISEISGGFTGALTDDKFGCNVSSLGDLDKDGVEDIAVGAYYDNDGGIHSGAVWILFLNRNGTVKSHQKISSTQGGLKNLRSNRFFGTGICTLGDMDGDGNIDIAVGAPTYDDDGGLYRGSIWILFLNQNGTVKNQQIISQTQGGLNLTLDDNDRFGRNISNIGDINGDGINDIAASCEGDDDGGSNVGALYILFLNQNGTVKGKQKISALQSGFSGALLSEDDFGCSSTGLGDVNGDGTADIAVGAPNSDSGGTNKGKVFILYLNSDATVKDYDEINSSSTSMNGLLEDNDGFGISLASVPAFNSAGNKELFVGSWHDDDGAIDAGAVYILDLDVKQRLKPTAIAGDDQALCSGSVLFLEGNLSFAPTAENPELTYKWKCSNIEIPADTLSDLTLITPNVSEPTTYHFVLTVSCQGINSEPDTVSLTLNPLPTTPTVQQFGDTLLASRATGYQWYNNGLKIVGAIDSTLYFSQSGNYRVKVINEQGCVSELSEELHFIFSSVEELDSKIRVFPIPATSLVNITGLPLEKRTLIQIYNNNAQLLFSDESDNGRSEIDFSGFNPGQYLIVIDNDHQRAVKIMKK
jgi:hypothetical protein